MASDPEQDKPERFVYGPRALSAVLPALLRPAFRGHRATGAQLLADWDAIVGQVYAAQTTPRQLSTGVLTIACAGVVAMELQHVAPQLIERINAHLGRAAVERLRFVQAAPVPRAAATPVPPRPAVQAARQAVEGLPPGDLRDALERLGRVVLAPRK